MLNKFFMVFVAGLLVAATARADVKDVSALRTLPVLDHGRVKPFDTVARESVRFITGSEFFGIVESRDGEQKISGHVDPVDLVVDWAANEDQWIDRPVLYVPLIALRTTLGMTQHEQWISPRSVLTDAKFLAWVRGVEAQRAQAQQRQEIVVHASAAEARLEDAGIELDNRLLMFEGASELTLYPVLPGAKPTDDWTPLASIAFAPGDNTAHGAAQGAWANLINAFEAGDEAGFARSAEILKDQLREANGGSYASVRAMDSEVRYNILKPFRWVWVMYLLAVMCLLAAMMTSNRLAYVIAMGVFGSSILCHAASFAWRCSITGWAPVTNMYETVIWVAMMAALFSYVLELVYRQRVIAIGGSVVALLACIVADAMPPEYGNAIRNLTPVLRSNYWLTIHVLTIVSSYAGFALAMVLGNIVLGQYIIGRTDRKTIQRNTQFIYRTVQIGVLLVAAGTILGGIWADYSWGRFWGWDPKEVWALITLLVYLALLHGRFAGWIKQFAMAVGAVMCFSAVLMSWYGVNFVLGAGLHSYGFESGGRLQVACFVLAQWAYVAIACFVQASRNKHKAIEVPITIAGDLPFAHGV